MFKRLVLSLLLVALSVRPASAQLPAVGPISFHGCDGVLSCHDMTFSFSPEDQYNRYIVTMQAVGHFAARGAYFDCSLGCAWSTNTIPFNGSTSSDFFHAGNCQSVTADPLQFSAVGARLCVGDDVWIKNTFGVNADWRPQYVDVRLLYQDQFGSPVTTSTTRLFVTPEPATYAMMLIGLGAIAVASRARRRVVGEHSLS